MCLCERLCLCFCLCEKTSTCVLLDLGGQRSNPRPHARTDTRDKISSSGQEKVFGLRRSCAARPTPSPIHGKNPTGCTGREIKGFGPEGVNCFPPGGGGAFDRRQMYEIIKVPFSSCHCAAGSKRGPRHHVMKLALAAKQVSIRATAGGQEPPWPPARSRQEGSGTGAYSAAAL